MIIPVRSSAFCQHDFEVQYKSSVNTSRLFWSHHTRFKGLVNRRLANSIRPILPRSIYFFLDCRREIELGRCLLHVRCCSERPDFWTESPQRQPRVAQDSSENARPQRRSRDLSCDGQFDQKVKQYTMATNRLRAFEGTVTSFLMLKHFAGVVPSRLYTISSYYGTILSLIDAIKFATPGYQPHVRLLIIPQTLCTVSYRTV